VSAVVAESIFVVVAVQGGSAGRWSRLVAGGSDAVAIEVRDVAAGGSGG
jgi:hypothetical protein